MQHVKANCRHTETVNTKGNIQNLLLVVPDKVSDIVMDIVRGQTTIFETGNELATRFGVFRLRYTPLVATKLPQYPLNSVV